MFHHSWSTTANYFEVCESIQLNLIYSISEPSYLFKRDSTNSLENSGEQPYCVSNAPTRPTLNRQV